MPIPKLWARCWEAYPLLTMVGIAVSAGTVVSIRTAVKAHDVHFDKVRREAGESDFRYAHNTEEYVGHPMTKWKNVKNFMSWRGPLRYGGPDGETAKEYEARVSH